MDERHAILQTAHLVVEHSGRPLVTQLSKDRFDQSHVLGGCFRMHPVSHDHARDQFFSSLRAGLGDHRRYALPTRSSILRPRPRRSQRMCHTEQLMCPLLKIDPRENDGSGVGERVLSAADECGSTDQDLAS